MPVFNKMVYNGTEYILGGGGNIGEPLNLTVTSAGLDATITWEDNEIGTIPPTSFVKSELVRKIGSAPTSPSDGTLVVTETVKDTYKVSGYVDQGLTDGTTYYYRVFSYSDLGGISYCDAVSITASSSWQPGANTVYYLPLNSQYTTQNLGNVSTKTFTATQGVTWGSNYAEISSFGDGIYSYQTNPHSDYSNWTMSVWAYVTGFGRLSHFSSVIVSINNYGDGDNKNLDLQSDVFAISSGNQYNVNYDQNYMNGWHHIAVTGNHAYIDGVELQLAQSGSNTTINTYNVCLFMTPRDVRGVSGKISEFIFEDKERTATEISNYFNQTKGDYGIS